LTKIFILFFSSHHQLLLHLLVSVPVHTVKKHRSAQQEASKVVLVVVSVDHHTNHQATHLVVV
jgi:hypothetical protein